MSVDQLTTRERVTLLALMAEAREVTNPELHAAAGVRLDGEARRRLNDRKLVTSTKVGRAYAHELTDDGWAWCRAELAAPRPAGPGAGVLYALLAGMHRYLDRADLQLSDVFRPDVQRQIRGAYARLAKPGVWVGLVALRESLAGASRDEVDGELERMAATPGVHVQAEPNQKALTDADRAAAVRFGGDDRHMLMIETAAEEST